MKKILKKSMFCKNNNKGQFWRKRHRGEQTEDGDNQENVSLNYNNTKLTLSPFTLTEEQKEVADTRLRTANVLDIVTLSQF